MLVHLREREIMGIVEAWQGYGTVDDIADDCIDKAAWAGRLALTDSYNSFELEITAANLDEERGGINFEIKFRPYGE